MAVIASDGVQLYLSILRDVTEQVRAEIALKTSEELFRRAFVLNPYGMNLNRLDDGFAVSINQGFTNMLGYTEADALGRTSEQLGHWVDIHEHQHMVALVRQTGSIQDFPCHLRSKDGRLIDGLISATKLYIDDVPHLISTIRDVSAQNRATEALKHSEERFRKAFDLSPEAMTITRLSDGVIVAVNRGYSEITGYASEEAVGQTTVDLGNWVDPMDRQPLIEGLRVNGIVRNYEARFRGRSGDVVDGLMSASVIDIDGVPHMLAAIRDITEQKHAQ